MYNKVSIFLLFYLFDFVELDVVDGGCQLLKEYDEVDDSLTTGSSKIQNQQITIKMGKRIGNFNIYYLYWKNKLLVTLNGN